MRIQNLKAPQETPPAEPSRADPAVAAIAPAQAAPSATDAAERQSLEIAFLKARIQHLELVVETARSLMGGNQERLLRQLHEVPRELVALGAQLRRIDPHAAW